MSQTVVESWSSCSRMRTYGSEQMSIHIDSCAEWETVVADTRSSVYELIVLRGDGDVLVRGGRHFTEFQRVLFLGSTADGSLLKPRTIDIGLRMIFKFGAQFIVTSPVQSLSRSPATESTGVQQPVIPDFLDRPS
jgi:hypothetical protein